MKTKTFILTCGCNEETFSESLQADSLQKQINDIEEKYPGKIVNISIDLARLRASIIVNTGTVQVLEPKFRNQG